MTESLDFGLSDYNGVANRTVLTFGETCLCAGCFNFLIYNRIMFLTGYVNYAVLTF